MQTAMPAVASIRGTLIVTFRQSILLHSLLLFPLLSFAQSPRITPVPGVVSLPGGILLKGMVSTTRSLDPVLSKDVLELRHIDQGFRTYDVSSRIGSPVVEDVTVIPSLEFTIRRKRGRRRMPHLIGAPQMSMFNQHGEAVVRLRLGDGEVEEIQVGVSSINRDRVEVTSLTHNWTFGMALSALPDSVLYPGLLEQAVGFEDGGPRLNMVGMLTEAGRVRAAAALLDNVEAGFPNLSAQVERERGILRQRTASLILQELQQRMAAGQPARAALYARRFPDDELTPQIRVDIRNLIDGHAALQRRVDAANAALQQLIGEFEDRDQKQQAREMIAAVLRDLDVHNIDRLSTWELLADDRSTPAETRLALAVSGWLLGADEAIQGFAECYGLFQIRQAIADYVRIDQSDDVGRGALARHVQGLEGFTVERVAALIRQLPPPLPLPLYQAEDGRQWFELSEAGAGLHCTGIVPSGYSPTRKYPLLIAVPRQGVAVRDTVDWWARQADRFGFIVAVAEVLPRESEAYTADADRHTRMLRLIRRLKLGLQIDDNRVLIAGHGVGGEIAMDMATSHAELFAGVVSVAGLGRRHLQWVAHNSADLGWYIVLGDRQAFWYERMGLLLRKLFRQVPDVRRYCNVLLTRYRERGFESYYEELPSIFPWMNSLSRNPWPERIDCRIMRSSDLSWHWVRLDSIPDRFQTLEQPTTFSDGVSRYATLTATLTKNNGVRVHAPAGGVLLLSPDIPGLDPESKISIRGRGPDRRIEFRPSVRDMLDEYARSGERIRLCHMKVEFGL